jgi:hypothetical protein
LTRKLYPARTVFEFQNPEFNVEQLRLPLNRVLLLLEAKVEVGINPRLFVVSLFSSATTIQLSTTTIAMKLSTTMALLAALSLSYRTSVRYLLLE